MPNRSLRFAPLALLTLVLLVGCKHGHSLDGTWTSNTPAGKHTVVFSGNNITLSEDVAGQATLSVKGTYDLKEDALTFNPTGVDAKAIDPTKQALFDKQLAQLKPLVMTEIKKENPQKLVWKTEDQVVMTGPDNKPETFDRSKS